MQIKKTGYSGGFVLVGVLVTNTEQKGTPPPEAHYLLEKAILCLSADQFL